MASRPMTIRLPDTLRRSIESIARRNSRDLSSVATEMLEEGIRMRRIPGIVFADGPAGRRARIAGTGLEVFEIVQTYKSVDEDWPRLVRSYDWLQENQLRAALAYYEAYPADVERFLTADDSLEEIYRQHPFMRPNQS